MKQISTSLAPKLKEDTITERDYIVFSGETTKHYLWFQLYDDCYKDGNFIGTFILKRIEFTYNDSDLEFKNKEFNAYKEYKLDDGTWESINYGTFIVQSVKPSDTKEEIKVTAYDYGLKFANPYVTELNYSSGTITLFQVLKEACQKVGVELENTSIENGDFIVDSNQFAEGSLFGNVITAIAQMSCNFAKITPENKLKLLFKNETNITIDTKDYEEFEDKRDTLPYTAVTLGVSDIEGENVSLIDPDVEPDEAKYLIINDNPFAYTEEKRTQLIQAIFNKINGFGYSSFVLSNCLYPQLECGDLIKIKNKDGQLVNSIVLRPTFDEVVINFEAPSTITSTVSYVQPLSAIETAKRAERKVDKANLIITDVVEEVGQYDNRITSVEQSVDKIEQQVNEAITLIRDVEGNGSITLENTSNTSLYKLSIKGDISLLFGNDGKQYGQPQFFREDLYFSENLLFTEGVPLAEPLYPSPNLFGKNMNLIIEYKEDDKEVYKLPFTYLNYLSQEVADEFILEDGKAKIIRRVGINSSMQKYELPNEVLEELEDFTIPLKEGNPKIYLQCFDSAIYNATYMIKNAYTEEFATKVELNSSISQLSNNITLEVNGKLTTLEEDLNGEISDVDKELSAKLELKVDTEKLISEINASADVIRLNSNRFSMTSDYSSITEDGEATFKKADIGGFITDETSFSKDLNGIYDYSEFDLQFLRYVLLDYVNISNDASVKNILDVINDGELGSADLLAIREIIQGLRTNNKVVQGSFYINSNNPKNCFVIKDNTGDVVISLGLGGVNSNQVVTQNIVCANTKTTDTSLNKYVTINGIDGNIKASGKIEATTITQTSIAEKKKNFELYQDALSEIAKIDIYKYNLIDEQDDDKKHIGFVIGNDFNYSKEITNKENNQVDLYSMISMCMQGLKEQQEIIKKLEKRIEVLENENIGKN